MTICSTPPRSLHPTRTGNRADSRVGSPDRRALLIFFLAFTLGTIKAQAWTRTCEELCLAVTPFQDYGTGYDDANCFAACNKAPSVGVCRRPWYDYFACVDGGQSMALCWPLWGQATECSVCGLGQVTGGTWSPTEIAFVNPECLPNTDPNTPPGYAPTGTYADPFCHFGDGIATAIARQKTNLSTRVVVCEGTYREGHVAVDGLDASSTGTSQVLVESAVKGHAIIAGSDDWTGAWIPQTEPVSTMAHNTLLHSTDPTFAPWETSGGAELLLATNPAPPPGLALAPVYQLATNTNPGQARYLYQVVPYLSDRRVTFSVYIRPQAADQVMLEFRRSATDLESGQGEGGAWASFQLPPGQACDPSSRSKDAEGSGVEAVGGGWYRIHLTQAMDHDPTSPDAPLGLVMVRLHLVGSLGAHQGVDLFAPQIDHRPLDQFATTPRTYLPTTTTPDSLPLTTWKNFWVNDPSLMTWTHDWGLARHDPYWGKLPPLMRRAEMIFLDGQPLRQELSKEDMEPGSFFVDDGVVYGDFNHQHDTGWVAGQCSDQNPCPITILPPSGTNMNDVPIEVGEQPRLLWLHGPQRWTLRGLTFRHSPGAYDADQQGDCPTEPKDCIFPLGNGAVALIDGRDLSLAENRVEWNNAHGLGVSGLFSHLNPNEVSNIVLERNVLADNGIGGGSLRQARGFLIEGDDLLRNNWRGARVRVRGHAATGAKYSFLAEGTLRGVVALENYGSGLWFDYENQSVTVTDCVAALNVGSGFYFEANDGWAVPLPDPTTFVVQCVAEGNEVGVQAISSSDIRLEENLLLDNLHAISLDGTRRDVDPPIGGQPTTKLLRDWSITNNTLAASCNHQDWFRYGDLEGIGWDEWRLVMESLHSNQNQFGHPAGGDATGFWLMGLELSLPEWQGCDEEADPWCSRPQDSDSILLP